MKIKNPLAVVLSLVGLIFIVLSFTTHYLFMIPAAIISGIGWKLMGRKRIE